MERSELRRVSALTLAALLAVASGGVALAAPKAPAFDPESARLALRTRQFADALRELEAPATQGVADAQYLLGLANLAGLGVAENRDVGLRWLRAAAQQGHAESAFALAGALADVDSAQAEARAALETAAKLGYPPALEALRAGRLPLAEERPTAKAERGLRTAFLFWAARTDDATALTASGSTDLVRERDAFGSTALALAARNGAAHAVDWLIKAGAEIDATDAYGITPLMAAAGQAQVAVTRALLAAGARVDLVDKARRSALLHAAWANQVEQIKALLDAKADPGLVDERGWAALDVAIQRDRKAAADILLARGAPTRLGPVRQAHSGSGVDPARPGELYKGWAPLLVAASRNDVAAVRKLIADGADVNAVSPPGDTALHVAAETRSQEVLAELLAAGADPRRADRAGQTVMARVALRGDVATLDALLSKGLRPDAAGGAEPVLVGAARRGQAAVVQRLLAAGASPGVVDAARQSPLILAVRAGSPDTVAALLGAGADVRAADRWGRSALWYAAAAGDLRALEPLLAARSVVEAADAEGVTPLLVAAAAGHAATVERLLAAGASATSRNKRGDTPLIAAAGGGHAAVAALLLKARAPVDATDQFGNTALILAARGGHGALCKSLLDSGANAALRNADRATAADAARMRGFTSVAQSLETGR